MNYRLTKIMYCIYNKYKFITFTSILMLVIVIPLRVIADDNYLNEKPSFSFMNEWYNIKKCEYFPKEIMDVDIVFPQTNKLTRHGYDFKIMKRAFILGILTVNESGDSIKGFSIFPSYSEVVGNGINKDQAFDIANKFIKYIGKTNYKETKTYKEDINENGIYQFVFENIVEDIVVRTIFIDVNYQGEIYKYFCTDNINLAFKKSPGKDFVINEVVQLLSKDDGVGYDSAEAIRMINNSSTKHDYIWTVVINKKNNGINEKLFFEYNEENKRISLLSRDKIYDKINSKKRILMNNPIWTNDGSELWWSSSVKWQGLPYWTKNIPSSIVNYKIENETISVFRPFIDYRVLTNDYSLPSLSSDGQWLLCQIFNNTILTDLKKYNIYYLSDSIRCYNRAAWRDDNKAFVIVDSNNDKVYFSNMNDDRSELIKLKLNNIKQIEFLTGDNIICIMKNNEENKWYLIKYKLDNINLKDEVIIKQFITEPYRMHVSPDKKFVIISFDGKLVKINLENNKEEIIDVINDDKLLKNNIYINYKNIDWDLSPDQKKIVFSAVQNNNKDIGCIYIINMDGTNLLKVSQDNDLFCYRYSNGKVKGVISKDNLSEKLLEKLHYIDRLEWPLPWSLPDILPRQIQK